MGRIIKPKVYELYGTYPKFNKLQIDYLKYITNPENKLKQTSEEDIANILGVDKKTLYNYRQDPDFREAIIKETFLKASDILPDQYWDLINMSMGWGCYSDIPAATKLQAKKLWWAISGFVDEAKEKHKETQKEVRTSYEQRLREIDKQYRPDSMEDSQ